MMTVVELTLILTYLCVLVIKTCETSVDVCVTFGFGESAEGETVDGIKDVDCVYPFGTFSRSCTGVYLFFIFFGLSMLLLLIVTAGLRLYWAGRVPKILLVAVAHSVPPSTIIRRVISRRCSFAHGWPHT